LAWEGEDKSLQAGQDIIKHNYNIRIIVIILKDILYKVAIEAVSGSKEVAVHKIEFDSRKIEVNDFVAIRGSVSNMIIFKKAIELGAVVIVCDTFPEKFEEGITYIQVLDTNKALAFMGLIISVTRLKIKVGWYHWNKGNYDSFFIISIIQKGL
jgi:hypothetical protein